jgi:hypothetical protein
MIKILMADGRTVNELEPIPGKTCKELVLEAGLAPGVDPALLSVRLGETDVSNDPCDKHDGQKLSLRTKQGGLGI